MRKCLLCLSILFLVVGFSLAAIAQTNILANPGFEDGEGTPPPPWITYGFGVADGTGGSYSIVTGTPGATVHGGTKAFAINGTTSNPIVGANGPRQWAVPVDPSGKTKYDFRAWIKKTTNVKCRIRWHQLSIAGDIIDAGYSTFDSSATGTWKEISTGPIQMTAGCYYVAISIYVEPNMAPPTNTGTVYIDDCSIVEVEGGNEFGKVAGTVTYMGEPVPGAFVGFKLTPQATSDPMMYTRARADGSFGPFYIANGSMYVAAWKDGWEPTADTLIQSEDGVTSVADLELVTSPGGNLALGTASRPVEVQYSSQSGAAEDAFDNDLTTSWTTANDPTGSLSDQYIYIDLDPDNGNSFDIRCVTLYWSHFYPAQYTVEYTDQMPNPWFGWIPIYEVLEAGGGFQDDPAAPFVNPIRFETPINARAIRIHCTEYGRYGPRYGLYEAVIHYDSEFENMGSVHGYIKDAEGNPIDGALVHIGFSKLNPAGYRQICTNESGFYSFSWFRSPTLLTADALGFANSDGIVPLVGDGTSVRQDIVLQAKPGETSLVPNWDFETPDPLDPSIPADWTMMEWDPQGETMFARDTTHNHTPGGTACGILDMRETTDPDDEGKWAGLYGTMFPIKADGLHGYNVWMWRTGSEWETYRNSHRILFLADDMNTVTGGQTVAFYGWGRWDANWNWWRTEPQYRVVPPYGSAYMLIDQIGTLISVGNGEPVIQAVDDVVVEEVPLASPESNVLADVKKMPVDSYATLFAKQLTAVSDGGVPEGFAFAQELDRSAGIMLGTDNPIIGDGWVGAGDAVQLSGLVKETDDGRKYLDVQTVFWVADTRPADCLAMNAKAARTSLAQDLLVKLSGTVIDLGADYFVLDDGTVVDGNPAPVKVYCGEEIAMPQEGDVIRVRGIVSSEYGAPVLYMRNEQVDWELAESSIHPLPFQGPIKALRDYLFVGVFGEGLLDQMTALETDYIAEATGGVLTEATVRPSVGDAVGSERAWFRHDGLDELVDLEAILYPQDCHKRVAYAHVYVWSPFDQMVDIPIGSDDGVKVWVNGQEVFSNYFASRTVDYGQDNIAGILLNAGLNSVLIKVFNGTGDSFGLVTQFAVPGTYVGPGWGGSEPMWGLGYLLNNQ